MVDKTKKAAELKHIWGRTILQLEAIQAKENIPTLAATIDHVVTAFVRGRQHSPIIPHDKAYSEN